VNVEILHEAKDELTAAIAYYEDAQAGLGIRLKEEARRLFNGYRKIRSCHACAKRVAGGFNLKVFQHYVACFIWSDTIWVVAMAHAHQRPEYWLERKNQIN
jgi:hypothetical protein